MSAAQHLAEIVSWLASDAVLTPTERAEYAQRLRAYTNPNPQASLPLRAAEEATE
jgi:hypothetical protein